MVVLDTCALFWWVALPDRLSDRARSVCSEMEAKGGVASSISFWEIGIKLKKGKLKLGVPFETFWNRVQSTGVLDIVPVDLEIWKANLALDWDNRDPADRTIVATAKLRNLPIMTSDKAISAFYPDIVW